MVRRARRTDHERRGCRRGHCVVYTATGHVLVSLAIIPQVTSVVRGDCERNAVTISRIG